MLCWQIWRGVAKKRDRGLDFLWRLILNRCPRKIDPLCSFNAVDAELADVTLFLMSTNLVQMSQENWPFMLLSCASQFVSFMNKYVNIILWCCWRRVGRCDLISYEHQSCTDVPGKLTLHNAPLMLIELKQVTYVEDHCPLLSLQIGWYHGTIVIVSWSHYHLF